MATPNERLAASLSLLRKLQKRGRRVFLSDEIPRLHHSRPALRLPALAMPMTCYAFSSTAAIPP